MLIIIDHLTPLDGSLLAVAGIDLETKAHVRPVLPWARVQTKMMARNGGPFDLAAIVNLGETSPAVGKPEVENHAFDPQSAEKLAEVPAADFWKVLCAVAKPTLRAIFGPELQWASGACFTELYTGSASLGCLQTTSPGFVVDQFDRLRASVNDGEFACSMDVLDRRFFYPDGVTPRRDRVRQVSERMARGAGVILAVGLSRPTVRPGGPLGRHWLQVHNVHFDGDPPWAES